MIRVLLILELLGLVTMLLFHLSAGFWLAGAGLVGLVVVAAWRFARFALS